MKTSVKKAFLAVVVALSGAAGAGEVYFDAAGGMFFPGGGSSLRRGAAEAVLRAGAYAADDLAFEVSALSAPNVSSAARGHAAVSGASVDALWHMFGYERFDPFLVAGAHSLFSSKHVFADGARRTAFGPEAGIGFFYHLTDNASVRFDARAAMLADGPCGMAYSVCGGLQLSFGGGGAGME